jgi:DNA (cytosine-5)-methyltransferase 1
LIDSKKKSSRINMLDLFSGVGGFHLGLTQAGFTFDWVGFSEIDKYASAVYKHKFKEAEELGDITTIQPERDLPDYIDILCGGFPCQAFSVAGKRKGFDDTRGTLFFEIARILRHYRDVGKPISCFLLENVKGLLSHDNGRTFATIYRVLDNLGYTIEFQLLNTRWWLPQNRQRIYIVGYIGEGSGAKVFPIGESSKISNNRNTKVANKLQHPKHSGGNDRGMIMIPEATKKGYAEAEVGDSINLAVPNSKTRRGRVGKGEAQTLDTGMQQYTIQPVLTPNHLNIRRLTPKECERLQGFPDDWTSKGIIDGKVVDISDTQRYKQCGNAVTVDVVQAVAERIYPLINFK